MATESKGANGLASKVTGTSSHDATTTTYPLLISNKPHTTTSSFPVHSPATGKLLHHFSSASIEDATLAVNTAQKAFPAWRALPPQKKRDIFLRTAEIMASRKDALIKICADETGAAPGWAEFNINLALEILKDVAGRISSIVGTIPSTAQEGVSALVYKEPYGVILAIAPWNAPYILGMRSIAFPLAAGNTALLKAPEFSPLCSHAIVSCFHDAGLPEGVLNLIAHKPSDAAAVTKHLIEHPSIKKVNFTGSTAVGKIIGRLGGENLKPVLLELGGKAPAIVLEDADLQHAAMECAVGAFLHSGQICMSTERVIVHESIADAFETEFKSAIGKFAPESQEPGCLINKIGVEKNRRLLSDAISKGASVIHGDPSNGSEAKMRPVVVKGVTKDMDLFYTESFGPTVSFLVVKSDEEAIELANDTEYGLSAAVFTKDLRRALKIARGIESGAVHINGMTVHDETALPHGGEFNLFLDS
jgi:acyl-CoA reductase-like NAD-dependent aldehyde dehydrogenase